MKIKVNRTLEGANIKLPTRVHYNDAGADVYTVANDNVHGFELWKLRDLDLLFADDFEALFEDGFLLGFFLSALADLDDFEALAVFADFFAPAAADFFDDFFSWCSSAPGIGV